MKIIRITALLAICVLAFVAMRVTTAGASSRCVEDITYTGNVLPEAGRENGINILLKEEPDDQELICTAFMFLQDGTTLHFGYDQQSECQAGYCVDGMEYGKYLNNGSFTFWRDDPPASESPVKVVLYKRDCWPEEVCQAQTPTPTATAGEPDEPEPRITPTPTPIPTPYVTISPPFPHPVNKLFLPFVTND